MKRSLSLLALFLLVAIPALYAVYSYYYTDTFSTIDGTRWYQNGSLTASGSGLSSSSAGALISKLAIPDGTSDYEVKTTMTPGASAGSFIQYLRATTDSLYQPAQGTYYSVEFYPFGYWGSVQLYRKTAAGGKVMLGSSSMATSTGMTVRSVISGSTITVYGGNELILQVTDSSIATGVPGVGVTQSGTGSITRADLGGLDRVPPSAVNPGQLYTSAAATYITMQWQPAADDANGTGVRAYKLYRNGVFARELPQPPSGWLYYMDEGLTPNTAYNYTVYSLDWHGNLSTGTNFSKTTLAAAPEISDLPVRRGVRGIGAYWGTAGEQIDTLTGNLNYSLPLVKAVGRGGWGVTFALSYNSQVWRKESGTTWKLGSDVGYGFGWRLMAGSVTPFWSDPYTQSQYTFTDASGATYVMTDPAGGGTYWYSGGGVYLYYNASTNRLYFNDGSWWEMNCVSSSQEPDAGTRYPTAMQDSNGNQIKIKYKVGAGASQKDTSARIDEIEDVRAVSTGPETRATYQFSYPNGLLTSITNLISSGENQTLTYLTGQSLSSPFNPPVSYGTTNLLQTVTAQVGTQHQFEYGTNNAGELTRVTLPYAGTLRWQYRDFTFSSGKTIREVQNRYLKKASGAAETTYALVRDDSGDAGRFIHDYTCINDPSTVGQKCWFFDTNSAVYSVGLNTKYEDRPAAGQTAMRRVDYTWTRQASGGKNPYILAALTTIDPGTGYQKQSKVEQTVDQYGNSTQTRLFSYDSLTVPARVYNSTYLHSVNSTYGTYYIRNRLATSSVTAGGATVQLVSNSYDGGTLTDRSGPGEHDGAYNTSFTYRGNVTQSLTPGKTVNTSYDITGAVVSANDGYGHSVSVTPAAGRNYAVPGTISVGSFNETLTYNSWLGVTSDTGPNQATTSAQYDSYGRVSSTTAATGATTTYSYGYGSGGYTATLTNAKWVRNSLDGLGRTIKTEAGWGVVGSNIVSVAETEYDSCACSPVGKVKRTSLPYAPGGTVYWTTNTYDGLGRTVSVALPSSQGTTTYSYQGSATLVTDPAGKWKKFINDAFGDLVQVIEPDPAGGADLNTYYTYDLLNHLTQVSMPRGTATQTRTFVYDSTTQRLMSATHPESGAVTFTYNTDGTVATKIDAKGQKISYGYDSLQRPAQITVYPNGVTADPCQGVTTYYDANPDDAGKQVPFTQNAANRVAMVVWGGSSCAGGYTYHEAFSYSSAGKVEKQRLSVIKSSMQRDLDAVYTYNTEGQVTSVKYPSWDDNGSGSWQVTPGVLYSYTFDSMGRPNKLTDNDSQRPVDWVKDVLYGPAGNVTQTRYLETKGASAPQDVYYLQTHTYNTLFQLTRMTTVREGGGGGTIMDMEYRFSATQNNGKITQHKDWVSGEEVTYQYDSLQRLIAATTTGPEWGQSFGYDGFGNLLSKAVTKGSAPTLSINVDGATNRITTSGFGYDANGNMTSMPGQSGVAFDALNRLTTVSGDQYSYRPDNKRLWKKLPGGAEEIYFYSIMGERWGAYQPVVSGPSLYLKRNSESLFFAGTMIRSQGQAVVMDRLGSVRSYGGTSIRYFPYGEEQTSTANEKNKFGTYFRDGTTGLDYAEQRYYGSGAGRFLSADPSEKGARGGSPQSLNRYGYVEGDPANNVDPRGLYVWLLDDMLPGGAYSIADTWISGFAINSLATPWGFLMSSVAFPWQSGYNCFLASRPGEDGYCWLYRFFYYESLAAMAAAAGGGGGGGGSQQSKRRTYLLMIGNNYDCYDVPRQGVVTRWIRYELNYLEDGMPRPLFLREGVIWEHLSGGLGSEDPNGDSPASGSPGVFLDRQSIAGFGTSDQSGTQRFSVVLDSRLEVGLGVAAFGGTVANPVRELTIHKHAGYVSINGDNGGRVDLKLGTLVPGTYTRCADK